MAVREDELAATCMGINAGRVKLYNDTLAYSDAPSIVRLGIGKDSGLHVEKKEIAIHGKSLKSNNCSRRFSDLGNLSSYAVQSPLSSCMRSHRLPCPPHSIYGNLTDQMTSSDPSSLPLDAREYSHDTLDESELAADPV